MSKPKYLLFRLAIAAGLLLGALLLAQTVVSYRFVAQSLLRQEAVREAERRIRSIGRAARLTGMREAATLTPVLHELVHEAPNHIAWIRILDAQGKVVAESEKVEGAPVYKAEDFRTVAAPGHQPAELESKSGPVLIVVTPLRMGAPDFARPPDDPAGQIAAEMFEAPRDVPEVDGRGRGGRGGRGGRNVQFAEIAIYLDGVSTNFGPLRRHMALGCAAAFALMLAVAVIGLRFRHYMRARHMEDELSLARRVQLDLFPAPESMSGARLDFAATCVQAYQVGGDLYDVFETDDGEVALVLGDVSGKGLPAALLMGVVQGAVRASCGTGASENHEQVVERLNQLLCMKTARERFVSLFWCFFDRVGGRLRYINAGHLPPLLIRGIGGKTEVIRLDEGGPVLGLIAGVRFQQAEVKTEPDDLLVVFSDGILEATNARDEEFGEEGVLRSVERAKGKSPMEIREAILADVKTFLAGLPPHDDQTLLVVKLEPAMAAAVRS